MIPLVVGFTNDDEAATADDLPPLLGEKSLRRREDRVAGALVTLPLFIVFPPDVDGAGGGPPIRLPIALKNC